MRWRAACTLAAFWVLVCVGVLVSAQKAEEKPLTNADVVSMVKAGLAESTILLTIQRGRTDFDTSPGALVSLKNEGVTQKVLDAMLTVGADSPTAPAKPSSQALLKGAGTEGSGKWKVVTDDLSPMDGSRTVVLALPSEQGVPGSLGQEFPTLLIRCQAHNTEAFIHTGTVLSFETDSVRVRLRLDDGDPYTENWDESTGHESLFSPNPGTFARHLAASRKLAFEFQPLDSVPVATWFDLTGLGGLLGKVADACGWSGSGSVLPAPAGRGTSSLQSSLVIRKIFVEDPHQFGYTAPGHIKKGLDKSRCLQLVDDPLKADVVLAPVSDQGGSWKWIFEDPNTKRRVGEWEMTYFPNAKKVEEAAGCR